MAGFEHRFEGREVLDGLLDLAGSALDSQETLARFVAGHQAGEPSSKIIPTLFDGEPHFPDPELARRLYQNLLGLWDLVASGRKVELNPTARPKREKPKKPEPPPPWSDAGGGPDTAWVDAAWQYLEALPEGDARTLERFTHAFENREDALLQQLDEQGLSDDAYATARYLLFELFVMLEVGRAAPEADAGVPSALRAYAEESLEESELPDVDAATSAVMQGLNALWRARTRKKV